MVVCRYFQLGKCLNGEGCRFEHPSTTTSQTPLALNAAARTFDPAQNGYGHTQTQTLTQARAPCVFFLQGTCKRGFLCRYNHDVDVKTSPLPHPNVKLSTVCAFFLRNACNKGAACPYSHAALQVDPVVNDDGPNGTSITSPQHYGSALPGAVLEKDSSSHNVFPRAMAGATVTFAEGAVVSILSLPSDFSVISMSNIPLGKSVQDICDILGQTSLPKIAPSAITLKSNSQASSQSADIKVADPNFAANFLRIVGRSIAIDRTLVLISTVQLGGDLESGTNRLQLSSVSCTWHYPSKMAYLEYSQPSQAKRIVAQMKESTCLVDERRLTFVNQAPSCWVTVSNLNATTSKESLKEILPTGPLPIKINMGQHSHECSAQNLQRKVKALLESYGTLLEFVPNFQAGGSKVKTIVKFADPEAARLATKELDGKPLDSRSGDKLRVQPLISIKLSVSQRVLQAVKPQLDALTRLSSATDYVSIKAYDNPLKPYTQLRVSGQNRDSVARAKSSLEKLLAGKIATEGTAPISHPFLFQEGSTAFLAHVMESQGVIVTRDRRKMVLRLYGEASKIAAAETALVEKLAVIDSESKDIVLDPVTLQVALKGGFRRIVEILGKEAVRMDIVSTPKRIIVKGSERHVAQAEELLRSYDPNSIEARASVLSLEGEEQELCPVCWTPPDDAFKTKCGHTYCSSCLASQCICATEFPLRCLGDSATCNAPLSLKELKQVLAANDFEALLQTSFTHYIRSRPTEFQYCSTPDCDRFYRTSSTTEPRIFNCDGCLTAICTGCHQPAHDGLSCEAYKAAQDGTSEFAKWKQENDVRDCPQCATPIQKSEGCNHMECKACRIHICWFCMKTFKTGPETYGHMNKEHAGNWGMDAW